VIPFIHLGPLPIPTFGLMVACAMLGAYFVLRADLARRGLSAARSGGANARQIRERPRQQEREGRGESNGENWRGGEGGGEIRRRGTGRESRIARARERVEAETLIAIPCLAGIIGAKLYHVLETPQDLLASPLEELFSPYGFAWFGGFLAGLAAFIWIGRRKGVPLLELFDAGSPAAALGYGIGRIGCLLSGDGDYGIPTSLPWGMSFPNGLVPTTERVHPTPIYEFIAACAIAWILWRLGARASRVVARVERSRRRESVARGHSLRGVLVADRGGAIPRGIHPHQPAPVPGHEQRASRGPGLGHRGRRVVVVARACAHVIPASAHTSLTNHRRGCPTLRF
jgi:prolipoprotein diacylglyceryltransferase